MKFILSLALLLLSPVGLTQTTCSNGGQTCTTTTNGKEWVQFLSTWNNVIITAYGSCAKVSSTVQAFVPLGSSAEWLAFRTYAPVGMSSAGCTCTGAVAWTIGSNTCNFVYGLTYNNGDNPAATDSGAPTTGTANFQCTSGSFVQQGGATCVSSCAGTTLSWAPGCSVAVGTQNNGWDAPLTNSAAGFSGTAGFTCNNGTWSAASSPSCTSTTNGCTAATLSWGGNCSVSAGAVAHGWSGTLTNSAAGYTGTAGYSCNNGTRSGPTSPTCTSNTTCESGASVAGLGGNTPTATCKCDTSGWNWCTTSLSCLSSATSCSSQTMSWLTNCSGPLTGVASGSSSTATNSAAGYNGSATYACTNGTWGAATSTTCTASGGACGVGKACVYEDYTQFSAAGCTGSKSGPFTGYEYYYGDGVNPCDTWNCVGSSRWTGPACTSCPAGTSTSDSGPVATPYLFCRCPSGNTWNGTSCAGSSFAGVFVDDSYEPSNGYHLCSGGSIGSACNWGGAYGGALCTQPDYATIWKCTACAAGTSSSNTGGAATPLGCKCPAGQTWNGSSCVAGGAGCPEFNLYWWSGGAGQGSTGWRCAVYAGHGELSHGQTVTVTGDSSFYGPSPCGCCTTNSCPGGTNHNEGTATLSCNNGVVTVSAKNCMKLAD